MQRVAMPDPMRLSVPAASRRSFQALRVEGGDLVVVAEEGGRSSAPEPRPPRAYLNGEVAVLRYLSALRIDPRARRSTALARYPS
ncbi:MAG: hypothetical protein U1G05_00360 [Kiritimatiellia bacterium]